MAKNQQVVDPTYRSAKLSRMHRKAVVNGNMTLPAVPSMLEEYVQMCDGILKQFGVIFTNDQLDHFRGALKSVLTKAFNASPRSEIVIRYECPTGLMLNYTGAAQWQSLESRYETWVTPHASPLFLVQNLPQKSGLWPCLPKTLRDYRFLIVSY
jgi:hypothetical protein